MIRQTLVATAVLVLPVSWVAADDLGIDPIAIEIATASSDYLESQPEISVGWFITYDDVIEGREKRTNVWTGDSLLVRGEGYRTYSVEGSEIRDHLYDGSTFTAIFADQSQYARVAQDGSFDDLLAGSLRCLPHRPLLSGYDEQQTLS